MAARHYNLEYSIDGGATWIPAAADEAPGPDKTLAITGLAEGTYAVRLRMIPLSGDVTPIVSDEVILQVGRPAIVDPVQSVADAIVTVADVAALGDQLLAAVGVQATVADTQQSADQLASSADVQVTGTDVKQMIDDLVAAAESNATADTIQQMAEQLVAAAAAEATVVDVQTGVIVEPVTTNADAQATITDLQTMLESVLAAASAQASQSDGMVNAEIVTAAAEIVPSVEDTVVPAGPPPAPWASSTDGWEDLVGNAEILTTGGPYGTDWYLHSVSVLDENLEDSSTGLFKTISVAQGQTLSVKARGTYVPCFVFNDYTVPGQTSGPPLSLTEWQTYTFVALTNYYNAYIGTAGGYEGQWWTDISEIIIS